MRQLAHIEKIISLEPIVGADRIEVCKILGWDVVVQKGLHKVGDLVCYIETDSILPKIPTFFFMEPRKYRVKIIKLRKQISMGLIISLDDIVKAFGERFNNTCGIYKHNLKEGDDVTEKLGIIKHDPQAKNEASLQEQKNMNPIHKYLLKYKWYRAIQPKKHGRWPNWIVKTDEERIQNIPSILTKRADTLVYWSEKLDGQSASYSLKNTNYLPLLSRILNTKTFTVCSRNIWLKRPSNQSYWEIAKKYDLEQKLKAYNKELVIQGEICGPGIQKNKYQLKELDFYVFNIFDLKTNLRLGCQDMQKVAGELGLKTVPILGQGILKEIGKTVPDLVKLSTGKSVLYNRQREGIVVRSALTINEPLSFKVINPEFLLNLEEDE